VVLLPAYAGYDYRTVALPDGSLTTGSGAYAWSGTEPLSCLWDLTAGNVVIEGTWDLSGVAARKNTWDLNTADADDYLGVWPELGLKKVGQGNFNPSDGVWFCGAQWTGGGDAPTDVREVLHFQEEPGTQPDPRYWSAPRSVTGDTWDFKLEYHLNPDGTTGWAKWWLDGTLIESGGKDRLDFTGEDLGTAMIFTGVMNGNNPNNGHVVAWENVTATGYCTPELPPSALLGLTMLPLGVAYLRGRRRKQS